MDGWFLENEESCYDAIFGWVQIVQLCFGKQWDFKNWEALSLHGIRNHLVQLSEGQGTLKISLVISSATTNDSCSLKAMLLNEIAVEDWNFTYNMCAEYLLSIQNPDLTYLKPKHLFASTVQDQCR